MSGLAQKGKVREEDYSLFQLFKPEVLSNPYPLYQRIFEHEPVHWDPFMNSWLVTSYEDVVTVLTNHKAERTPTPKQLESMGLSILAPYGEIMLKQMLFRDAPAHTRLRSLCATAFTPKRIELLREMATRIANDLIDRVIEQGRMDVIADFASPFPSIVLGALMGLPESDREQLKSWSRDVSELLGNFEHDLDVVNELVSSLQHLIRYISNQVAEQRREPRVGVISTLLAAEVEGARLTDEEVVANSILMIAGGLEETTNLIGNGLFSLLQRPEALNQLREKPEILQSAVEELLRFESPTQHTGRLSSEDVVLSGKNIRKGQSITALLAAANRDPRRFPDPNRLNLTRTDNRHLAFGWASHYCLGSPLSRLAGQVAFAVLSQRLPEISLVTTNPPWRRMAAMRGITSLVIEFDAQAALYLRGG